ncbi:MAG TPA: site-specific integrase, partial [Bacteroidetes bacterium]|nr:site-specific integrase [Bacteroidota bacterium]HEX03954.1 site-specific integrase [Bacteroidota bacterium]
MASIRKRTSGKGEIGYHVQIRLKGYPTQTASFTRLTDARKWAASTESAILEGRHFKTVEAKKHTLSEFVDRYVEQIVTGTKNDRNNIRNLHYWKEQIGDYLLVDVTPALIVESRDKLRQEGRSDSTANRYMTSLSHAFTVAVNEWEWIESNPCRKIKKLREPRGRTRFLSDDERSRLLSVCQSRRNPDLYHAVVLSLATGARQGEILGMSWDQVDLGRQVITLTETKNNEIRLLPLSGLSLEIMRERSKIRRLDTTLV